MTAWRLLLDGSASGEWNMAVDEALLAMAAREGLASLRLYSWDGAWLSLGYAQELPEARLAACAQAGVGVVRRVTGGRAVLHGQDLTYSLAAPEAALPPGLTASYDLVAGALVRALQALGVAAERSAPDAKAPGRGVFDCFAEPAANEICVGGRKLLGSAQRRMGGAVLQHGSLRLHPDPPGAAQACGLLGPGATSLAEEGCQPSEQELRAACLEGFSHTLGRLQRRDLTPGERDLAHQRARERGQKPLAAPPILLGGASRVPQDGR